MRRILIIAALVAFAQATIGFSPLVPQTIGQKIAPTARRAEVNARTIAALARGKNYVVDLTQRGVKYEFNHEAGHIDFSRVRVRTAQGEVALGSWLEKTFLKGKLAGFKWTAQAFSIRTRSAGTLQTPPPGTSPPNKTSSRISCDMDICSCVGDDDCDDLLDVSSLCGDVHFCIKDPISRQPVCSCGRRWPQ